MMWPTVILSCVVTAGYALVSCCWLIYGGCGWCRGGGVLVSNNWFFTTKQNSIIFGTLF